jgi:hypothetical protein
VPARVLAAGFGCRSGGSANQTRCDHLATKALARIIHQCRMPCADLRPIPALSSRAGPPRARLAVCRAAWCTRTRRRRQRRAAIGQAVDGAGELAGATYCDKYPRAQHLPSGRCVQHHAAACTTRLHSPCWLRHTLLNRASKPARHRIDWTTLGAVASLVAGTGPEIRATLAPVPCMASVASLSPPWFA